MATIDTLTIEIGASSEGAVREIAKVSSALKRIKGTSTNVKVNTKDVDTASKKVSKLGEILGSLKRIAMYRAIRSAIKAVTQAFSEGLKNAYAFSAGMEGESYRFAAAMDRMSGGAGTMKNQLGSAFIGLLAAIAPVINAIIGLITALASALSMLFGAFTGGTWLRASNNVNDMADACGGGAAAAKEWKNQLMGFDEINKLEDTNGGGGGGGGAALGNNMFEEAELEGWFAAFRQKLLDLKNELDFNPLKESVENLKTAFKGLAGVIDKGLAWGWDNILVPLTHWTIEQFLPTLIETLASAFNFLSAALEALSPFFEVVGDFFISLGELLGDAIITALQTLADLFQDLADLLNGKMTFAEFIDQLTPLETVFLAVGTAVLGVNLALGIFNGLMAAGTAIAGVFGAVFAFLTSPIGLVIAAIAAAIAIGIALYQNWDTIKEKAAEVWDNIKQGWENFSTSLSESFSTFWNNAKESFSQTWEDIKSAFSSLVDWFSNKWDELKSWWNGLSIGSFHIPLPHLSVSGTFSINPPSVPYFSLDWYANGGFPEDGLFMANHGELVGKFSNGRTAVANNEQIIAGISAGVYEAVVSAMSATQGDRGGDHVAVLNVNGREFARAIYRDSQAVANEHGVSLIVSR